MLAIGITQFYLPPAYTNHVCLTLCERTNVDKIEANWRHNEQTSEVGYTGNSRGNLNWWNNP